MERQTAPGNASGVALDLLELLAAEASPDRMNDLVRHAAADADPATAAELDRARELALHVHSLFARRQQREAELAALIDTARDLTAPHELDTLLKMIVRRTRMLFGVDMSYISFRDRDSGAGYVRTSDGHASALTLGYRVPGDAGLGWESNVGGVPIWSSDYLADDRMRHSPVLDDIVRSEGLRGIIASPLTHGSETFGTLYAADRNVRHFSISDVSLMTSLSDLAAVAIEKARTLEQRGSYLAELGEFRRFGRLHTRLTDLALRGAGLQEVLAAAASALDCALEVRDADQRRIGAAGDPPEVAEEQVRRALGESYRGEQDGPVPVRSAAPDGSAYPELWVIPLTAGYEELAVLLMHARWPLDDAARWKGQLVAQPLAVLLQMQRGEEAIASPFRDELFEDLLATPGRPVEQLAHRAARLGLATPRPMMVLVGRPEGGSLGRAAGWAAAYARRTGGLRSIRDGCVSLLLPLTGQFGDGDDGWCARRVKDEMTGALGHPVTVGASGRITGLGDVRDAHREATRCLDALLALDRAGSAAAAGDLGFLGLLLSDAPDATSFVTATIGPLLEYDRLRLTELTRTLEEYFAAGGSPSVAAEALHVHANTVYRRLERVAEVLGPGWSDPDRALDLQLALRLHRTRRALRSGPEVPAPDDFGPVVRTAAQQPAGEH
ncbi:helix-turn-helix domain-containing protein [Streptomyces seoulensis]|uniref:helix-turn-helix domain-containing protein n=1 Tax=Streptomyces seoulensis TaxID=73044 RepID=UPI003C30C844